MYTKKFAVMNVIGNDEIVLRTFAPEEKERAIAYGEEVLRQPFAGVLVCAIVRVDENGNKAGNSAQVFRVWEREGGESYTALTKKARLRKDSTGHWPACN